MDAHALISRALETSHAFFPLSTSIHLIAAGKAAWPMARAADAVLGSRVATRVVAGPQGPGEMAGRAEWFDASHPVPNGTSMAAGERALDLAASVGASDAATLLLLLSGGASSMLCAPAGDIGLEDKSAVTSGLMRAGADIAQLNVVRKHLSRLKGGRLGAAARRAVTLALSDVHEPPDDPATIGSGPTVADPSTYEQALAILAGYDLGHAHPTVLAHLQRGAHGHVEETIKPGDPRLAGCSYQVLANRRTAMRGAAVEAQRLGYACHIEDAPVTGEARLAGRSFAERAVSQPPTGSPLCVIASGETTVTVRGPGRGGRNQEFVLGAVGALRKGAPAVLGSVGTDGIDGPTDAAGALVASTTAERAASLALDITAALESNDAYPVLDRLGALLRWGPTFTNVGDVHVLLTMGR